MSEENAKQFPALPESKLFQNLQDSKSSPAPVMLTKFCPITNDDARFSNNNQATDQQSTVLPTLFTEMKSFQMDHVNEDRFNQADETNQRYNKWPWTNQLGSKRRAGSKVEVNQGRRRDHEHFELVWHRLSFDVNVSTHNQLYRRALNRIGALWRLNRRDASGIDQETVGDPESQPGCTSSKMELASENQKCSQKKSTSTSKSRKRNIFQNLSGYLKSGEITAILGPSGAGKTSFLNAICGSTDNYRGSIQLVGGGTCRMRLSVIPQKDYLMENLTVRENLLYSSRILNTDDKRFDHEANIMRVVKMLNLTHCFHSRAANISGGEYKRVSIAQELLRQPDILILDEPTSGLDSLNCKKLIKSLGQLIEASNQGAMKPLAIVMTIHQPDIDIFQRFDHVYCMARGGKVIYDGPPGKVFDIIKSQAGFLPTEISDCTANGNPANLLIEIASEEVYGCQPIENLSKFQRKQFEGKLATIELDAIAPESYKPKNDSGKLDKSSSNLFFKSDNSARPASVYSSSTINQVSPSSSPGRGSPSSTLSDRSNSSGRPSHLVRDKRLNSKFDHTGQFWHHTKLLAARAFISTIRDPMMTIVALLFHMFVPFVMYTVYSKKVGYVKACPVIQREMDMISVISNKTMGLMEELQEDFSLALECSTMFFLAIYSFSVSSLSVAALTFPLNMHVLLKEVRNGWYNLRTYVVAKTIANFPFEVLFPVASIVMIYLLLDMPGSYVEWRIWAMALAVGLISMISHTQGLICGALCMDSVQTAIFLASASTLPQTMLSGFTARIKNMPEILQSLSWLSMYRYSSDTVNIIRFGFGTCPCDHTTDDYLKTKPPVFTDVPENMKPLFVYYLTNTAPQPETSENLTHPIVDSIVGSNNSLIQQAFKSIPGLNYQLALNSTERAIMVRRLENNELDLFGRMAEMVSRSLTYGREVNNCNSVRSQLLSTAGSPSDDFLPYLFAGMFGLLVMAKLILFVIVKYKIGSRI